MDYLKQKSDALLFDELVLHRLITEGRKKQVLETDVCDQLLSSA
jgi:hypothetical protein